MAKSKIRRKPKRSPQAQAAESSAKAKSSVIKIAVAAGLIAAAGWWWYGNQQAEELFFDHVRQGAGTLDRVERLADHGTSGHLNPGERVNYGTNTPTSGRHDGRPVTPGVYTSVQAPTRLVHSLEHGLVVVYYDRLSAEDMATLEDWNDLYGGPFNGMVVTRQPGLGDGLLLTAWRKSLSLDGFDADAAAVFIDAYRGRGPENPIR